ncbi:hypothetical protein D3C73_1052480 [compost metagenome]
MHASHGNQVGAFGLVELIEVRLVLEEVGVQAFFRDLHVRLDIVGEDFDLQVDAFFGQRRLNEFEDFRVRNRGRRDSQGVGSVGGKGCNGSERDE